MTIDLNCDLGEGGAQDDALMPLISSANVACGGHAGDRHAMRAAAALAARHRVAVGAHPGFAERGTFGRREQAAEPEEIRELVLGQVGALMLLARVRHVKPHGALYHLAERDEAAADALASAVRELDRTLLIYGLAGGRLLRAARAHGLAAVGEGFADRAYRSDGSLVPRGEPGALIEQPEAAAEQALEIVRGGAARAADGTPVRVAARTLCVHGDGPRALETARAVSARLRQAGIAIEPPR